MTLPDQSMTVKEIMQRHSVGLPSVGATVPVYDSELEPDFDHDTDLPPDLRKLDISEVKDLQQSNKEKIADIQKKLREKNQRDAAEKTKSQIRKELEQEQQKNKSKDDSTGKPDHSKPPM